MLALFERVGDDVRALRACGRACAACVTNACAAWATTCVRCARDDVRVVRAWVTAACGARVILGCAACATRLCGGDDVRVVR